MDFKPDFLIIPYLAVENENLQPLDRILYGVIYYFERMKYGQCIANNKTLAEYAKCSVYSVKGCLKRLSDEKFITCFYEDREKKIRVEIKTNIKIILDVSGVASGNARGSVKQRKGLRQVTLGVASDNAHISNIDKEELQSNIDKDTASFFDAGIHENIIEIFNLFRRINPTINYGHKTNRKSCETLIKRIGYEKLIKVVQYLISVQGQRFAPVITTPYQLEQKFGELMIYYKKENTNNIVSNIKF